MQFEIHYQQFQDKAPTISDVYTNLEGYSYHILYKNTFLFLNSLLIFTFLLLPKDIKIYY